MKSLVKGVVTWSYEQYRSNACKEYDDFYEALFRELIQNSSDAGSKNIHISIEQDEITCIDDGVGMDLDIIQNKLLVIGGSEKIDGAVGGLGKAKELLFFSWPKWIIETNNHRVEGEGGEYEIFELDHPVRGTKVILHRPKNITTDLPFKAISVARRCYINPNIFIDDALIDPYYKKGRLIKSIDNLGKLYVAKTENGKKITDQYKVQVCVNGCWMFDKWIGEHDSHIVFDVDSKELDPLTIMMASRDSFKYEYGNQLDALIQEIVVDKKSALTRREPTIHHIKGDGPVFVPPSDEEIDKMAELFMKQSPERILAEVHNMNENYQLEVERIKHILTDLKSDPTRNVMSAYEQILNYEPDFIIYEDVENDKWSSTRIKKFMQTKKASTIAQVWTETVKQVLWDNKISIRFVAGFLFDKEAEAMFRRENGQEFFLINPIFVPATGVQNKIPFVNYMRTTAVHEITHKYETYHDEDFVSRYHHLESKTWNSHRLYSKIGTLR